jgi:hypothetical protein
MARFNLAAFIETEVYALEDLIKDGYAVGDQAVDFTMDEIDSLRADWVEEISQRLEGFIEDDRVSAEDFPAMRSALMKVEWISQADIDRLCDLSWAEDAEELELVAA